MIKLIDMTLNYAEVQVAFKALHALNNKRRQAILNLIAENREIQVKDIYAKLKLEQSVVSQQLAIMRNENIVLTKRAGIRILYSINTRYILKIKNLITKLDSVN